MHLHSRQQRSLTLAAVLLLMGAAFSMVFVPSASAQTEEIPCNESALRATITAATVQDVVLPEGCVITLTTDLPPITKALSIDGAGAVINGGGEHRPFRVDADGDLTLTDIVIQNSSSRLGGALYVAGGSVTLDGVTFRNNTAVSNFGGGAVLVSSGEVSITSSTFADNAGGPVGGALAIYDGEVSISGSTFSGNHAISGGAVSVSGGDVTITSSTFVDNRAQRGGGLYVARLGTLSVAQSIVAGNRAPQNSDVYAPGSLTSGGYNLFGSTSFGAGFETDLTDLFDSAPRVSAFTGTAYGLLPESLAVDAIPQALCATETDQRGIARPQGEGCDIGAVEMEQTGEIVEIEGFELAELVALDVPAAGECSLSYGDGLRSAEVPADTYCRVLMRDGGWVANPGSVPQSVIDRGVVLAIEVFSLQGGQALPTLDNALPVCLMGQGRLLFLDATGSPRTEAELPAVEADGYTCGFVPAPGTLALVQR